MSPSSTSSSEADGLVPAPPGLARSGWRRAGAPLIVGLFLTSMAGSGILDLVSPAPGPALTDMDEAERKAERALANIADGSLMTYVDRRLQEQSNVRATLVPWYIAYGLLPVREGGSGVMVGREGWLFLNDRIRPRGGTHRLTHARLAANTLTAFDRRVSALGVDTLFLPLPRKATIATPFVPSGTETNADYEQDMLRLLRERRVPHVNLYDVWKGLDPASIWQREDTHWSQLGMWLALDASARAMGYWVPPEERVSRVEMDISQNANRQLLMTLGIPKDHPVLATMPRDQLIGPRVNRASLKKLPKGDPSIVHVGTSFSAGPQAAQKLSHIINRRVLNVARGGTVVGISLEETLTSGRIPDGAGLLVEVPSFQLQGLGFGPSGPELMNSSMAQPLCYAEPPAWDTLIPSVPASSQARFDLNAGQLATTGDGIAHLELTGKPTRSNKIRVTLMAGDSRLTIRWRADVEKLHVPLITADAGAPTLLAKLQGAPGEHSIQVGVVTELDLDNPLVLPETPVTSNARTWQQDRPLPADSLSSRHAALWIQLAPKGPTGPIEVELVSDDGSTHAVAAVTLARGGTALLRASAPEGAWTDVRIKGAGKSPKRIGHVRVVGLPGR